MQCNDTLISNHSKLKDINRKAIIVNCHSKKMAESRINLGIKVFLNNMSVVHFNDSVRHISKALVVCNDHKCLIIHIA